MFSNSENNNKTFYMKGKKPRVRSLTQKGGRGEMREHNGTVFWLSTVHKNQSLEHFWAIMTKESMVLVALLVTPSQGTPLTWAVWLWLTPTMEKAAGPSGFVKKDLSV